MRLLRALLLAQLLGPAVVRAADAGVYIFGGKRESTRGNRPSVVSPFEARLLLAHRLGLSQYYNLRDADESIIPLLDDVTSRQVSLFAEPDDENDVGRLVVVVEGVDGAGRKQRPRSRSC
jgi:hypothetical protein